MAWGGGTYNPDAMSQVQIPGAYINLSVTTDLSYTTGARGVLALPLALEWGSDDEVITVSADTFRQEAKSLLGYNFDAPELTPIVEAIDGGATTIYIFRTNSGEKATGTYATARCSGELGNTIDIVIEDDPDFDGVFASITGDKDSGFTITYENLDINDAVAKVIVTKKNDSNDIGTSAGYSVSGESPIKVKILENLQPGSYTVRARIEGSSEDYATKDFTIPYPVSADITGDRQVGFTVSYQHLTENSKTSNVIVTKSDNDTDIGETYYTIDGNGTDSVSITLKEEIEPGNYKIRARVNGDSKDIDTEDFTVPPRVTATISGDRKQGFTVTYENLKDNFKTAKVFVSNSGDEVDIGASTNYTVQGDDVVTLTLLDTIAPGSYKVRARVEGGETDLDSQDFTVLQPVSAEITGKRKTGFTVTYQNLTENETSAKVIITKQNEDDDITDTYYQTSGEDSEISVTLKPEIAVGNYTIHARTQDSDKDVATQDFTVPEPVTANIDGDRNTGFTVTYTHLEENEDTAKVIITKTADTTDIGGTYYKTSGEETGTVTVTLEDTLEPDNYTVRARVAGSETDLATADFEILEPTATISKDSETVYKVTFENADKKTRTAKLYQSDGSEEVTASGNYELANDNTNEITVTFLDGLESNTYKLKALIDGTKVLKEQEISYTKAE